MLHFELFITYQIYQILLGICHSNITQKNSKEKRVYISKATEINCFHVTHDCFRSRATSSRYTSCSPTHPQTTWRRSDNDNDAQ